MHLHFERLEKPSSYSDCNILALSWMGKVPEGLLQTQEDEGWKLNRANYYQDGWLSCGNVRGIVGVTYTTCRCRKTSLTDQPTRTNYNLRGHRSEVMLVKWNEPYQKLASCDSSGIIFVWIKYEGRWSIELINDRNTKVTDFAWSHDGRMALICYRDGFVLVGSVAGQRFWSTMLDLNLDTTSTTCGVWAPDDQQVILGTSHGHLVILDVTGTLLTQLPIREGVEITSMMWSCEKFKMEDTEEEAEADSAKYGSFVLAVCFADGILYLMKSFDDLFPVVIMTGLQSIRMEWSNKGEVLAIAGHRTVTVTGDPAKGSSGLSPVSTLCYENVILFYTETGSLRYRTQINYTFHPITAITWGHNDKRLFVATGPVVHIAWVTKRVPSLQLISRLAIYSSVSSEGAVDQLPLPCRLQNIVASLFGKTLRCYMPDVTNLRDFVANPPSGNIRLQCTMIRHEDEYIGGPATYVLYLEYLGGLVPILKGKRTSKLRPEFIIFDPHFKSKDDFCVTSSKSKNVSSPGTPLYWNSSSNPGTSDSELDEGQSPIMKRKLRRKRNRRPQETDTSSNSNNNNNNTSNNNNNNNNNNTNANNNNNNSNNTNNSGNGFVKPENTYSDEMPESEKMVLITSNIWGTKFKILGLASWLPSTLGTLTYKTSLLHLQPRRMTLQIKELGERRKNSNPEPNLPERPENNSLISSEDEDEGASGRSIDEDFSAPIAPMTPKKNIRYQGQSSTISPERRPSHYLRTTVNATTSQAAGHFPDYMSFIPAGNEDLLTLQINGDSSGVTQVVSMEIGAPAIHVPAVPSSSISTQTSFQSITELLTSMSFDKPFEPILETESKDSIHASFWEQSTDDIFTQMAKKLSTEMPSSSRASCPASHGLNLNKFEFMQPQATAAGVNQVNSCLSPTGSPPNMSPPKSYRHKMSKKESPRKVSVSCSEQSDLNATKHCDNSPSVIACNSINQKRLTGFAGPSQSSGPSTTWAGGVSLLQYPSGASGDPTCLIDAKPVQYMTTAHDIKFIDEMEGEEGFEGPTLQGPFSRSPSLLLYRNITTAAKNHFHSMTSDFTNIRSSVDSNHYTAHQRRLTLKTARQSRSLEAADTAPALCSSSANQSEKVRNCMSFDEEGEEREPTGPVPCACNSNLEKDRESVKSFSCEKRKSGEALSEEALRLLEVTATPTHNPRSFRTTIQRPLDGSDTLLSLTLRSQYPLDAHLAHRSVTLISSRDQSTDTLEEVPTSRFGHRGSLPQAALGDSLSINSMSGAGAQPVDLNRNRSLPASPILGQQRRRKAQGRGLFYSPMMLRKVMKQKLNYLDCSSEDENSSDDESRRTSNEFKDLSSFQKAGIKKKIKVKRRGSRVQPDETSPKRQLPTYREFVLHNKAPFWNDVSQVYQLDFGGRVTQESAKNFQIEHQGKQVMQFGRIDGNAYTLDFQYPFSALQALAVALANVTQRLK